MLKTIFTIFLSSAVGYGIISAWQRRNWLFQQKIIGKKELYESRYKNISDLSEILTARIIASENYLRILQESDPSKIDAEREKYKEAVFNWSANFTPILHKLKADYDATTIYEFDHYAPPLLVDLEGHLRKIRVAIQAKQKPTTSSIDASTYLLKRLKLYSAEYCGSLYKRADRDREFIEKPEIVEGNYDDLSLFYLLKNIFKPITSS